VSAPRPAPRSCCRRRSIGVRSASHRRRSERPDVGASMDALPLRLLGRESGRKASQSTSSVSLSSSRDSDGTSWTQVGSAGDSGVRGLFLQLVDGISVWGHALLPP
jgi:hypothetical protein